MSISGIHGQLLEITVVACNKLKDTEWISRQDPYVVLEYGSTKFRTRTHKDGGKNPTFQEKFTFTLIEGLRELNIAVWNSNTISYDDFIGTGKVQLYKVLSQGYDDNPWPIQTKTGRHAGEVRLIMHYANANKPNYSPSAPVYQPHSTPQVSMYSAPPPAAAAYPPPPAPYSSPSPYPSYSPTSPAYGAYPHNSAYPPAAPYPPQGPAYPPYPATSVYPPPAYPPPPQSSYYPPPGPFPGLYPPRPY